MLSNINILSLSVFIIVLLIIFLVYSKKLYLEDNFLSNYIYKISPKIKFLSLVLSLILLSIAFLEPRWFGFDNTKTTAWNVVFVLDVTKSMNALDYMDEEKKIVFSKLDTAKKLILDTVKNHKENAYWLVAFAWNARVMSPITQDFDNFEQILLTTDANSVKTNWTNILPALERAAIMFPKQDKANTIVLLSDWWDEEINFRIINNILKEKQINVLTIWLGSKKWSFIPDYITPFWEKKYKTYKGEKVVTFLNEKSLSKLEGEFMKLINYKDLKKAENKIIGSNNALLNEYFLKDKKNLTRIFVMISFVLFCFYLIIDLFWRKRQDLFN